MSLTNRAQDSRIDTVFLADQINLGSYLSSSIVRQLAKLKGNISEYVSEYVKTKLEEKFHDKLKKALLLLESLLSQSRCYPISYWLIQMRHILLLKS